MLRVDDYAFRNFVVVHSRMRRGLCFRSRQPICLCLSVCLCVSPVRALTFESLDLETLFLVWTYIFRISRIFRPSLYVKVIGSRSNSHEPKKRDLRAVAGGSH